MASNYEAICRENRESYGTKGAQKSGSLAAGLYDDRAHFNRTNVYQRHGHRVFGERLDEGGYVLG